MDEIGKTKKKKIITVSFQEQGEGIVELHRGEGDGTRTAAAPRQRGRAASLGGNACVFPVGYFKRTHCHICPSVNFFFIVGEKVQMSLNLVSMIRRSLNTAVTQVLLTC